jgi:hypothetical protein
VLVSEYFPKKFDALQSFPDLSINQNDDIPQMEYEQLQYAENSCGEFPECLRDCTRTYCKLNKTKSLEGSLASPRRADDFLKFSADSEGEHDFFVNSPSLSLNLSERIKPSLDGYRHRVVRHQENEWYSFLRVALVFGVPLFARNLGSLIARLVLNRILLKPTPFTT